jgi:phage terminase large subunit-like protein
VILQVPGDEPGERWPTLGLQVAEFIEAMLVHGPGEKRGDDIQLLDEQIWLLCRWYEVYPRGHPLAGRRRFRDCHLSLPKGTAKTELAAFVAITEAHPEAPVRCDGWRKRGGVWEPVGRPLRDPYIPMIAYTEEQTEDLAYGAVYAILTEDRCAAAADFDPGLQETKRRDGRGSIKPLSGSPNARDGARTTFQHFDETHRFVTPRLREAVETMTQNVVKGVGDGWSLSTTTMFGPGEGSVAEDAFAHAAEIASGAVEDPAFSFFHRQASPDSDFTTDEGRRAALIEARGPYIEFTDVEGVVATWHRPSTSPQMWKRLWCNLPERIEGRLVDPNRWAELAAPERRIEPGAEVVGFFDGSQNRDASVLGVVTVAEPRHAMLLRAWIRPQHAGFEWRVPRREVHDAVADMFARFNVRRLVCDPWGWQTDIEDWSELYGADAQGEPRVLEFDTRVLKRMAAATDRFLAALREGSLTHSGDQVLTSHVLNMAAKQTTWGPVPVKPIDPQAVARRRGHEEMMRIDGGVGLIIGVAEAEQTRSVRRREVHVF